MVSGIGLLSIIFISIVFIVVSSSKWKWHPFLSLITAAVFIGLASGIKIREIPKIMAEGFGNMMAHIGIIVILGTLIGIILEKTGATEVIANAILNFVGHDKPVLAITMIGLVVGIPIFCDSGYIILSGLTRPLANVSKKPYASIVAGLAGGLYITHTLLPPHPGSMAGAANLGLGSHLGMVLMIGLIISIPVSIIAWIWSEKGVKNVDISLSGSSIDKMDIHNLSLIYCLLPIVIPVILIALGSLQNILTIHEDISPYLAFVGHPIIALSFGLLASLLLLKNNTQANLSEWIKEGISHAGPILILVGAGGIFGNVLKNTSLSSWVLELVSQGKQLSVISFFMIAYFLGILLKTAQGSTTSAIIVVSSILAPMCQSLGVSHPFDLTILLCCIASGSMMISHANDAYFWVISQFSGLSINQTYKTFSATSIVLSISSFALSLLAYFVLSNILK